MSYFFNGSDHRLTGTYTSDYAGTSSIACWFKYTTHPAVIKTIWQVGKNELTLPDSMAVRAEAGDDQLGYRFQGPGSGSGRVVTVGSAEYDGDWVPAVCIHRAADDHDFYVGSYSSLTTSTSITVSSGLKYVIAGTDFARTSDFVGYVAELAHWQVALTHEQALQYIGGLSANQINSSNLVGYWSLKDDASKTAGIDAIGALTATGAAWNVDHPPINYGPVSPQMGRRIYILP